MTIFLLMACAILPVLSCVLFLQGVDPVQLVWSFLTVVACSFSCAAVGIMCSAIFRGTVAAILVSYVATLYVPMGLGYLLTAAVASFLGYDVAAMAVDSPLPTACPFIALVSYAQLHDWQLVCVLVYQMFIVVVCSAMTVVGQRVESKRVRSVGKPQSAATLEQRRRSFPYYLIDPEAPRKPIEDNRNPILVKELRWGIRSRASLAIRLFSVALFVSAGILFLMALSYEGARTPNADSSTIMMAILIVIGLILLIAPALFTRTFGKEDERGNLDLVRMTLLTPGQIVWGRLLSATIAVAPAILGSMVGTLFISAFELSEPHVLGVLSCGWITLVVLVLLCASLGLFSSVVTRTTGMSILLCYGLSAAVIYVLAEVNLLALMGDTAVYLPRLFWYHGSYLGLTILPFAFILSQVANGSFVGPTTAPLVFARWVGAMIEYSAVTCCAVSTAALYFAKYRMQDR